MQEAVQGKLVLQNPNDVPASELLKKIKAEKQKLISEGKLKKEKEFVWLKEINSQSLQSSLRNLDTAYNKFFRKQTKFPRFKSKYDRQSFTVPQFVTIEEGKLWIPKFKKGIEVNLHREIEGNILFATIFNVNTNPIRKSDELHTN